ncbi:MAG: hypothetical protein UT42_C0051G0009 [Candidatus Falkowbacteria bacterium GW2011_GWA2_39_24]|uniref:Uncharacterized protein n=1 Tax=Candidatus Falkowbacteria bacterium GW2011_GWA2_39_24 TaxID=1618634 RepID=A0A0G0NAL1_9BACT|nr:MAG: hypothetical protein UT42_C0051G0009 [Candidatus Falkowbacteria bacterium GW2011_GWA2_39_24]
MVGKEAGILILALGEIMANIFLTFSSSASVSLCSTRQLGQSLRTRRWPIMAFIDGVSKNGLTPKSKRRGMTPAASLVCKVESTK